MSNHAQPLLDDGREVLVAAARELDDRCANGFALLEGDDDRRRKDDGHPVRVTYSDLTGEQPTS